MRSFALRALSGRLAPRQGLTSPVTPGPGLRHLRFAQIGLSPSSPPRNPNYWIVLTTSPRQI